jgi:hypothetical protein
MPSSRTVVLVFGRFNPPTTGHGALVNFVNQIAQRNSADVRVYPSQTQDSRKNPLPFRNKVAFLRKFFPKLFVSSNVSVRTPVDAFAEVSSLGYRRILMIVGSDRVRDFQKFAQYLVPRKSPKYNAAKHIDIDHFQVIAVPGNRDPDADDVSGMSASKMRALAKANDFKAFGAGIPSHVPQKVAKDLFNQVRQHMGLREMFNLSEGQFNIGLLEAPQTFTIVAIVNNKVVDQQWDVSKMELPYGVQNFQRDHPKATLSIENARGRVVSVIKPGQQYKEGLAELSTSTKKFGWSLRNLKPGTWVKISDSPSRSSRGKVVRYDKGDRHGSPFYVIDVGKYESEKIPAHNVVKEDVEQIEEAGEQMDEATLPSSNRLGGRPASSADQRRAARIISNSLGRGQNPLKKTTPAASVNAAIKIFLNNSHSVEAWNLAGQMLNRATELGIKWDQKLLKPTTRKAMKMDEASKIKLPPHLAKLFDRDGNLTKDAADRVAKGKAKFNVKDVTPKGYGINEAPARSGFAANPDQHVKVGDKVRAGLRVRGGAGFDGTVERIDGNWIYVNLGPEPGSKWGDRIIKAPRKYVMVEKDDQWVKEAATPPAVIKPPTETEKLRTTQQQELIALKTRQANTMMAAKLRDVQQKAREQQAKANQPKSAASPASS